jgi:hypothetical protein
LERERQRIENIYDQDSDAEYDENDENGSASEDENIDHNNYRGIYCDEEPGQKFSDPETGAHFEFQDMCTRIGQIDNDRKSVQERTNIEDQLIEVEDDANIYKTQDHKKHIIQTKSNKNKDKHEIIKQLNEKINSMFKDNSKDTNPDLKLKGESASCKFTYQ